MRIWNALIIATGLLAAPALAGPFGVSMGQPITGLRPTSTETRNVFRIVAPQPNEEFESYWVVASPETGVCKVWGTGKDHANDRYGSDVRDAYRRIKAVLAGKYGSSDEVSFLRSGALWKDENEWVMSVRQKERTLITYWLGKEGSSLPADIVAISLEVRAVSNDTSYLTLTYEFSNFSRCQAKFRENSADGL